MRVHSCAATLGALLLAAPLIAQNTPAGHWDGTIRLPNTELAFDVDLELRDGAWSGDISIPQQNARDLPLADVRVAGDTVSFEIAGVPGAPTFRGTISGDGARIEGTFTQGGGSFPFAMARGESVGPATSKALEGFDAFVEQAMRDWLVPGAAIAIVRGRDVVYSKGFGRRDVARDLPVTPRTLFAIGSATKAFTTFAMGRLVDEGDLDWDEPAIRYLPGLRLWDEYATAHLTPRDMVTHRSGLPRHDFAWYNNLSLQPEQMFASLHAFEPNADLRERFQYNNMMFVMAGHLVSRLAGKPWQDAIRDMVLVPLGMDDTNFSVQASQQTADHALPYGESDDTLRRLGFRDISNVGPAGSINSNIEDLANWLIVHLNEGTFNGRPLLDPAILREMHTPQIAIPSLPLDAELGPTSYGLGWFIDMYRGHYRVQHGGNIDGFSALVSFFPREDIGIVVLTNRNGTPLPEIVVRQLADRLFGAEPKDWSGKWLSELQATRTAGEEGEKREEAVRRRNTRPSHPLAEYAGEYRHPGYGPLRIARSGDRLSITYNGIQAPLEHWHFDVFRAQENPADPAMEGRMLSFRSDLDGRIASVVVPMEPSVDAIVFERAPDPQLSDAGYLQRFVGEYTIGEQRLRIALEGDRLTLSVPGQPLYPLVPRWDDEFELADLNGFRVAFTVDRQGRVTEAVLRQPNGTFPAKRVQ